MRHFQTPGVIVKATIMINAPIRGPMIVKNVVTKMINPIMKTIRATHPLCDNESTGLWRAGKLSSSARDLLRDYPTRRRARRDASGTRNFRRPGGARHGRIWRTVLKRNALWQFGKYQPVSGVANRRGIVGGHSAKENPAEPSSQRGLCGSDCRVA